MAFEPMKSFSRNLRRALVGAQTRSLSVAKLLNERGLLREWEQRHDVFGPYLELDLTNNGRLLAESYRLKGEEPESPPPMRPAIGLRGLVVLQPWAALIASGRKVWENRKPSTATVFAARSLVGQRIAIVEGLGTQRHGLDVPPDGGAWEPEVSPGSVIVTVKLERVVAPGEGLGDPYRQPEKCGYYLTDRVLLQRPVKCAGGQGWLDFVGSQPRVAADVKRQDDSIR